MTAPIYSQAPTRIDLAGGTLDIWPLYLFHDHSQTVNFAINLRARCELTPRRDRAIHLVSRDLKRRETFPSLGALRNAKSHRLALAARLVMAFEAFELKGGFTLETDSGVPAGSGLGGSSSLNIAICGALARFTGQTLAPEKLIEIARNVEAQVLRVPTGEQDYYAAFYGGAQAVHLTPRGVRPEKLEVDAAELRARFVLCYTGHSRNSGINNWEVLKAHVDGKRSVIGQFGIIAAIAAEMRQALLAHDWKNVAGLISRDWRARKKNYPGITTPEMEKLFAIGRRNGAVAVKACGAGGGGCVVLMVEPEGKTPLEIALRGSGVRVLPFDIPAAGLEVSAGDLFE